MSRYISVNNSNNQSDPDGADLPDWQTARREAVRRASKILEDEIKRHLSGEEWRLEVTDGSGLNLFRLDFCFTEAAPLDELLIQPS